MSKKFTSLYFCPDLLIYGTSEVVQISHLIKYIRIGREIALRFYTQFWNLWNQNLQSEVKLYLINQDKTIWAIPSAYHFIALYCYYVSKSPT